MATGGTDNHIVLADVAASFGLTGRQAECALRTVGMTLNRNSLPFDANGPWYTSGLRLGTPALTTLGMGAARSRRSPRSMTNVLRATTPVVVNGKPSKAKYVTEAEGRGRRPGRGSRRCASKFPVYPEIDLSLVEPCGRDPRGAGPPWTGRWRSRRPSSSRRCCRSASTCSPA